MHAGDLRYDENEEDAAVDNAVKRVVIGLPARGKCDHGGHEHEELLCDGPWCPTVMEMEEKITNSER